MFYSALSGTGDPDLSAQHAQRDARDAKSENEFIKNDIERLLMITEALWMLLKKEHGYEDSVLSQLIAEIDLRDGKLDGRVSKVAPELCPYCNRAISKKRAFCIFCGKSVARELFAR